MAVNVSPACQVDHDRDQQRQTGDQEDLPGQGVQLAGQRGLGLLLGLEHARDVPHLRAHPRGDDDELPGAAGDVGVHVDHVGAVAERCVRPCHRRDALRHRKALPGERRLGHLQGRRAQQPAVGRDDVAGLDRDDVARDQLFGRQLRERPVAPDPRRDDHHLLQRRHRGGGLALLAQTQHGVEHGEEQQQDAGAHLLERVQAPDPGDQEHELHRVRVLTQEGVQARLGLRRREPVRAEPLHPGLRLGRGQALRRPRRRCAGGPRPRTGCASRRDPGAVDELGGRRLAGCGHGCPSDTTTSEAPPAITHAIGLGCHHPVRAGADRGSAARSPRDGSRIGCVYGPRRGCPTRRGPVGLAHERACRGTDLPDERPRPGPAVVGGGELPHHRPDLPQGQRAPARPARARPRQAAAAGPLGHQPGPVDDLRPAQPGHP